MKSNLIVRVLRPVQICVALTIAALGFGSAIAAPSTAPSSRTANVKAVAQLPVTALPAVDAQQRLDEDAANTEPGPLRYAIPVDMSVTPDNAGTWETLPGGARLWRYRVHAPGATDLNFGFTRYHLPHGATLHVISEKEDYYHGPYTQADNRDHGQHWTPMVPGDRAVVELYVPAKYASDTRVRPSTEKQSSDRLTLELGRVGAGYRDLFGEPNMTRQGACNIDTICPQGDNWRDEIRSVGQYSLGGSFFCTGTIIMDVPGTFTPWWLTADHCGLTAGNAPSVVVLWNFEAAVCGALSGGIASDTQSGATWRAARADADFTLLELSSTPDPSFDVFYSGWDATGTPPLSSVGISHPSNDEKALAFNIDALSTVNSCIGPTGVGNTHWFVNNYEEGMTEPGSSGSGIWNTYGTDPYNPAAKRLVGVLSGGGAACAGSVPNNSSDCYGKFSEAWDGGATASTRLVDWLDPGSTGTLFVNGADPGGPSVCGDSMLGAGEQCDDGNAAAGDGCSATCQVEAGWECTLPIPGGTPGNLVADGGFEAGTPNPSWTEMSINFGTPLCDVATCGTGGGTGPNSGAWWAWFGGITALESGSVAQSVVIPSGATSLTFELEIPVCGDGVGDFMTVKIDGNIVASYDNTDAACGVVGYATQSIDLVAAPGGPYNDGAAHTVLFESSICQTGCTTGTNFFVDDVLIDDGTSTGPVPSMCTLLPEACYEEDFDPPIAGDFGQIGWTVFDVGPLQASWGTTDDGVCGSVNGAPGNHTGSAGEAACIDSDANPGGDIDAYLCSNAIDLSAVAGAELEFTYNYQVFQAADPGDFFEVLVGTTAPSGATIGDYDTVFTTNANAGVLNASPGVFQQVDLSGYDGTAGLHICYRYGGDFDWYAQVDDVAITADDCSVVVVDTDGDGVTDDVDNCVFTPNAAPLDCDTDNDGIGNRCDADIDTDPMFPIVNFFDLQAFGVAFQTQNTLEADLDCSGFVNFDDLFIFKSRFGVEPGAADAAP